MDEGEEEDDEAAMSSQRLEHAKSQVTACGGPPPQHSPACPARVIDTTPRCFRCTFSRRCDEVCRRKQGAEFVVLPDAEPDQALR